MRTVPSALIWEMFARGRWQLVLMMCAGCMMPLLLYTALRMQGAIDTEDSAFLIIHITLVQINMFIFGAGIMTALGPMKRLYTYPVQTSTLVTWQLIPAMVLMAIEMAATSAALNALYDLRWPLLGPALFAGVALSVVVATLWLTEGTGWLPWVTGLVAAILGFWFKTRHGPLFSEPTHYWNDVTFGDGLTLLCIGVAAHCVAVYAVSRHRRGEPLPPMGFVMWFERAFDSRATSFTRFASPHEAMLWSEWQKKGWAMPGCVLFGGIMGGSLWLIFNRDPRELIEGLFLGGGALLSVMGMLGGLIIGNCGPNDASHAMGPFLATRPLTTPQMARILLWTAAKSTTQAWLLWVVPVAILYLSLVTTGVVPSSTLDSFIQQTWWWYAAAALLGPWTVCTCLAAIAMTGRVQPFMAIFIGGFGVAFLTNILTGYLLTNEQSLFFWQCVFMTMCALAALGTVLLFVVAHRRTLIDSPTLWTSMATWGVLIGALTVIKIVDPQLTVAASLSLGAAMALVVAPIAGAPLALAWNRTR